MWQPWNNIAGSLDVVMWSECGRGDVAHAMYKCRYVDWPHQHGYDERIRSSPPGSIEDMDKVLTNQKRDCVCIIYHLGVGV